MLGEKKKKCTTKKNSAASSNEKKHLSPKIFVHFVFKAPNTRKSNLVVTSDF